MPKSESVQDSAGRRLDPCAVSISPHHRTPWLSAPTPADTIPLNWISLKLYNISPRRNLRDHLVLFYLLGFSLHIKILVHNSISNLLNSEDKSERTFSDSQYYALLITSCCLPFIQDLSYMHPNSHCLVHGKPHLCHKVLLTAMALRMGSLFFWFPQHSQAWPHGSATKHAIISCKKNSHKYTVGYWRVGNDYLVLLLASVGHRQCGFKYLLHG